MSDTVCLLPPGVAVDRLLPAGDRLILETHSTSLSASCPQCQEPSFRRHSAYRRRLADLPWQGHIVELQVRVRRFRCANDRCPQRVFAERLPKVTLPKARRTVRLREVQQDIGVALGGEPGARLARRLAMPLSPDTLLRLVRALRLDTPAAPRVVGVDDWAFRRGQRYGTILCDLERGRTLDLLPDREAATLAAWLKAHPTIAIVARDRAGAYAEGIRQGLPNAVQVADRFHLLCNCSDALTPVFDRHHRAIRQALEAAATAPPPSSLPAPRPNAVSKVQARTRDRRLRREARYAEAARLQAAGVPLRRIARFPGSRRRQHLRDVTTVLRCAECVRERRRRVGRRVAAGATAGGGNHPRANRRANRA